MSRCKKNEMEHGVFVRCLGWTIGAKDGCNSAFQPKDLTYIQTFWYTPPYSCSGGDYWNYGEGQFICPLCGVKNRLYERPDVENLKHMFGKVEEQHDR